MSFGSNEDWLTPNYRLASICALQHLQQGREIRSTSSRNFSPLGHVGYGWKRSSGSPEVRFATRVHRLTWNEKARAIIGLNV